MMNIKSFKDGNRKVVVFENLDEKTEKKISTFLGSLIMMSEEKAANLEPLNILEEKIPTVPVISTGLFKGKTGKEVFSSIKNDKDEETVFNSLETIFNNEPDIKPFLVEDGMKYLSEKFLKKNPEDIKLSDHQKDIFMKRYVPVAGTYSSVFELYELLKKRL